jgi:hypothetical protein
LISLSLRSTTHPLIFQHQWVRASSRCYPTFTLAMDRSPGFGSIQCNYRPIQTRFPFASPIKVKLAASNNSLTHYTKGTQSLSLSLAPTACTHTVSGSISLPSTGFFSPFPHGTGSLSVDKEYLALEDGPPIFSQDISCPDLLFVTSYHSPFVYGTFTPYGRLSQIVPLNKCYNSVTGLLRFRSPLLAESRLISLPLGT